MSSYAPILCHPILGCDAAREHEARHLGGDSARTWEVMRQAGRALADLVEQEFPRLGEWPPTARLMALVGQGHNGGDALLATRALLERHPQASAWIGLAAPMDQLRPLTRRALEELVAHAIDRIRIFQNFSTFSRHTPQDTLDVVLDGMLGLGFRPPVRDEIAAWIGWANAHPAVGMRVAVDLPSGLGGDGPVFRADLTGITGIPKAPLFTDGAAPVCGRIRYLDLGFFDALNSAPPAPTGPQFLLPGMHRFLNALRPGDLHKYKAGQVAVLGGSPSMPGALAMACEGALHAGAGLVTAVSSEEVGQRLAGSLPEVLWEFLPSTAALARMQRTQAIVCGPGLYPTSEALELLRSLISTYPGPLVLDAGALQVDVLSSLAARPKSLGAVILTPHAGEYRRLQQGQPEDLEAFCQRHRVLTILKGPVTRISDGYTCLHASGGGPILARGGTGDILAGMVGSLLAEGWEPITAAALAVSWQGAAADRWARRRGERAVRTTEFFDHLAPALRGED